MVTLSKSRVSKTKKSTSIHKKDSRIALSRVKSKRVVQMKHRVKKEHLNIVDTSGKVIDTITPTFFEHTSDQTLIAQAIRVYLHNQREKSAATKTRGLVEGSTRKIYRQKGTGKARHGSVRAPIFVGGGIVFGPVPGKHTRTMSKKMKRLALRSALRDQYVLGNIIIVDGLESIKPKTKLMVEALSRIGNVRSMLLVTTQNNSNTLKAVRNIKTVDSIPVTNLNSFAVLKHTSLVFMKPAFTELTKFLSL